MGITYEALHDGRQTSRGNRGNDDFAAATIEDAAAAVIAEIAAVPAPLRPPVDEIRVWYGTSPTLPDREPDLVVQVPS